jgi:hypothetical protein
MALDRILMSRFETGGRHLTVLARLIVALVGIIAGAAGCDPAAPDSLVVATSWPLADRRRTESEIQSWLKASRASGLTGPKAIEINWLILGPGDDPLRVVSRRHPPDVLLGGRASALARLAQHRDLIPIQSADSALWSVVQRVDDGLSDERSDGQFDPLIPIPLTPPNITIDDPRADAISLAWARGQLDRGRFPEGYSQLVRVAGNPRRIGRQTGSALPASRRAEGVAILRSAGHPDLAQEFLRFLAETHQLTAIPARPSNETDPAVETLVADLLGATLVDAQDELWAAWAALKRAGYPTTALKRMTEAPPWPPASVAKILDQPGEQAMTLIETLAREIAPEPSVRAWLVRSWLSPSRLVDDMLLTELAQAEEGRLFREPRFRAWLRAEWTAWARQRYRRVLRVASY